MPTTTTYTEVTEIVLAELEQTINEIATDVRVHANTPQGPLYGSVSWADAAAGSVEFTVLSDDPRWHDQPETAFVGSITELEVTVPDSPEQFLNDHIVVVRIP